ncbi:MAG: rhomboid family intramembrane serine protease [Dehalococcoidales bacterium]
MSRSIIYRLNPVWILIGTNIILFIVTVTNTGIIIQLGLMPGAIMERPWTIISCIFLHGSIWHLLGNMVTLFFFGRYLRNLLGNRKFLFIYFIGGILGSVFYVILAPLFSISIGASGAVFALGGVLAIMRPKLRVLVFPIPVPVPLWTAVIGGFIVISFFPNVAWQSHLGGLILGLVAGYILRRQERNQRYRW